MTERDILELECLKRDAALAARLTDEERIRIVEDLWETAQAIRRSKSPDEIRREESARRELDAPGRERYQELAARLQ